MEVPDDSVRYRGEVVEDLGQTALESLLPTLHQILDHGSAQLFVEVALSGGAMEDAITTNSSLVRGPEQTSLVTGRSPYVGGLHSFLGCPLRGRGEVVKQLCFQRLLHIFHGLVDCLLQLILKCLQILGYEDLHHLALLRARFRTAAVVRRPEAQRCEESTQAVEEDFAVLQSASFGEFAAVRLELWNLSLAQRSEAIDTTIFL